MTENEFDVLNGLEWIHRCPDQANRKDGYASPLAFGGFNGSHHSATARRLTDKGLVDRRKFGGGLRCSCAYKITQPGLEAVRQAKAERNDR